MSSQCYTWDETSGVCKSCYGGYVLDTFGACVINPTPFVPSADSLCKTWSNNVCNTCANWAYFDSNGVCRAVSTYCNTFDAKTGKCLACFAGYDLSVDGACVYSASNNAKPADLGCGVWDWNNNICLSCAKNWVFNTNKICVPVSDLCKSAESSGLCASCYRGYDLLNGACVFSASNNIRPSDLGCYDWDWNNNICLTCSRGWAFNANKVCVAVSDLCKTVGLTGACTTCFKGYDLLNGVCTFSN